MGIGVHVLQHGEKAVSIKRSVFFRSEMFPTMGEPLKKEYGTLWECTFL